MSPNDEKKKRLISILNGTDIHEIKALQEAVKKRDGLVEKTKDYEYFSKIIENKWWVRNIYIVI